MTQCLIENVDGMPWDVIFEIVLQFELYFNRTPGNRKSEEQFEELSSLYKLLLLLFFNYSFYFSMEFFDLYMNL